MIILERTRYSSDLQCPTCLAEFDIRADEDSNYSGAYSQVICPECGESLIIYTVVKVAY